MKYQAICNLVALKPSGAEDAAYRVARSHLNQVPIHGYICGEIFTLMFRSLSGLWLKDSSGTQIFVPIEETQCFSEYEED